MVNIYIEISKGSNIKYEHEKETNTLILDRILHNTNIYPFNYGYIPNTLSPDGDPLDVILLCDASLIPGCIAKCKVIGGIHTEDENGIDEKILMVLDEKLDITSKNYNNISDISETELENIKYFLNHYKDNETNKFVKVGETYNKETALQIINKYTLK